MATTSNSSLPKPVFLPKSQRHNLPNAPLSYSSPSLPHPPAPPPPASASDDRERDLAADDRERDLAAIRSHYLGPTKPKKRRLTTSAHGRFNFSWSGVDDTSDPAPALGPTADSFHPLFGRGLIAGIDRPLQKNSSKKRPHPSDSDSNGPLKPLHNMTERDFRILLEDLDISIRGCRARRLFRIWPESGLSPKLLEAVSNAGYEEPSPIQMVAIPFALDRRDLIGTAKTGSGKTAAFVLPMLHHISSIPPEPDSNPDAEPQGPLAVVLAPTRELALQIEAEAKKFARGMDVKVMSIVGGQSIEQQGFSVYRGCDVVIATPGRLLDCLERRYIVLNQCHCVVLDEADRMIDMGFEDQVVKVLDAMPSSNLRSGENEVYRTTMMFSATMPRAVEKLAKKYLREPVTITVGFPGQVTDLVTQQVIMMKENEKMGWLERILDGIGDRTAIVFVNTKKSVDVLAKNLDRAGYRAITFHGGMGQKQREKSLESFKDRKFNVLVATDVAGRGIDIPGVSHVINYDMPNDINKYTHRIGRTGRIGKTGTAITFLTMYDADVFYDLKQLLVESRSPVPQELARHEASKFKLGTVHDRPHREH